MVGEKIYCIFVVMNFGDYIVRVAGRLIVPKYDVLDRAVYLKYGRVGEKRYYEIIYILKENEPPLSNVTKLDIIMQIIEKAVKMYLRIFPEIIQLKLPLR